jgi:hypothetical protein
MKDGIVNQGEVQKFSIEESNRHGDAEEIANFTNSLYFRKI